jgi:outer membrane biosynthesis protein TonB
MATKKKTAKATKKANKTAPKKAVKKASKKAKAPKKVKEPKVKEPKVKEPKVKPVTEAPKVAPVVAKPIEITSENVEKVAKTAPTAEEAKSEKASKKSLADKFSAEPEAVHTNPLLVYSDSIRDAIRNHFRMMSRSEINDLMQRGGYPFKYEIKQNPAQPTNQIFIEISDAQNKARIPNNEDDFISTNG